VGIFLNAVRNVRIHKRVIDGFDFGIFAINSKPTRQAPRGGVKSIEMKGNIINSRYTGVSLFSVDDAELANNHITHTRAAGKGLYIGRNSDSNKVVNNTFVANLPGGLPNAFRVPGNVNPVVVVPAAAVMITQIEGPEPTLLNAIIGNQLFQLPATNSLVPNADFSEDNRFEGNTITLSGVPVDGVALPIPQGPRVIGNRITGGAETGIRVGMQNALSRVFPGTCTLEPSRLCLDDGICKLFGIDKGSCTPRETRIVSWISRDTLIQDNVITGPLGFGIATTGLRTTITGNTIVGPLRNAATGSGIRLSTEHALKTTTLTRNTVSNVAVVFSLIQEFQGLQPTSFTAKVSLNDFTGYTIAALTSRTGSLTQTSPTDIYNLSSELSVDGQGNFWGTSCDVGLNPATVQKIDGSPNPSVTDSHPYQISVARTPLGLLPAPCR
jgi:hypothetical protein